MKILILGAGQVGTSVARNLASEANDITIVDNNGSVLQELQDRLDLRTIQGHASHPDVLTRAGAEDAPVHDPVGQTAQVLERERHGEQPPVRLRAAGEAEFVTVPVRELIMTLAGDSPGSTVRFSIIDTKATCCDRSSGAITATVAPGSTSAV